MHILKYHFANETRKQHGNKLVISFKKTNFLTDISTMSGKKVLIRNVFPNNVYMNMYIAWAKVCL